MDTKTQRVVLVLAAVAAGLVLTFGVGWAISRAAANAAPLDVVVSEVAWAGRSGATADEWIELFNNTGADINLTGWHLYTADGSPDVILDGAIPAGAHYLMERTDDTTVPNRTMDYQYTGALNNDPGEVITLTDGTGQVIDIVGLNSTNDWFAGSASPNYYTMMRINLTAVGTLESSWANGPTGGTPLNSIVDRDMDTYGYSPNFDWLAGAGDDYETKQEDCNDGNGNVNPGAPEIPGNKVDDDCDWQVDEGEPFLWETHFNSSYAMWAMGKSSSEVPMETELLARINTANTSIDAAIYGFNLNRVADALIAAHNRGVVVRLVGDDEEATGYYSPTYQTVISAGIPVVTDIGVGQSYLEHNKFAIFDGSIVWTGSTNWTDTGVSYNSNNTIVVTSTNMANAYTMEFEEMFGGNFHNAKVENPPHVLDYLDATVEVYFSPTDGAEAAIMDVISNTQESIHFAMFYWTTDAIGDLVVTKTVTEGLTVSGVWDATGARDNSNEDDKLCAAGVPLKVEIFGGKVHHKFAVIDANGANPVVITGSYNWTASAENQNDENVLIIYDVDVAQAYYQEYLRLYNALPAATICSSHSAESGLAACSDGADNDYDGYIDSVDFDCRESTVAACSDGTDNDGDMDVDLDDLDCYMMTLRWIYLPVVLK